MASGKPETPPSAGKPDETVEARCLRLEAALQAAQTRLAAFVDAHPDPLFIHREGLVGDTNPAGCRLLGVATRAEARGRDLRSALEAAAARGQFVEVQDVAVDFEGLPATLSLCRDVTERRRRDELRHRYQSRLAQARTMEAVGRMAGGVAHDFNNMLTVVLAGTEVARGFLEPTHPAYGELSTVYDTAVRSADFARHLLAFSRQSSGASRSVDLSASLPGTVKLLRRLLGEAVQFEFELADPVWPVLVDQGRLDFLLANLALNGREASGGAGKLSLSLGNVTLREAQGPAGLPAGPYVRLIFSDETSRPDEATRARLFEPLTGPRPTGNEPAVGLAAVREAVETMGGAITAESRLDTGTRFIILLPRHVEITQPPAAAPPAAVEVTGPARGNCILVVEDEPAALALVADLLRRAGYAVLTAPSPAAATAIFKAQDGQVDLLLTDVIMPALDGDQLARKLLAMEPALRILYMSGYPADILADRIQATPGAGFLPKPFTPTMLYSQVRRLLEGVRRP